MKIPSRCNSIFSTLLAMCLIIFPGAAFSAGDELESFPPELRTWLTAPVDVPADPDAFPDVLRQAIDAGREDSRQNIIDALHWIGYARLRFENDSQKVPHDISAYSGVQIVAVGIRMTHDVAKKLKQFSLWNILQLAQRLKEQMPEVFNSWQEMVE
jgi:hypothetical protein